MANLSINTGQTHCSHAGVLARLHAPLTTASCCLRKGLHPVSARVPSGPNRRLFNGVSTSLWISFDSASTSTVPSFPPNENKLRELCSGNCAPLTTDRSAEDDGPGNRERPASQHARLNICKSSTKTEYGSTVPYKRYSTPRVHPDRTGTESSSKSSENAIFGDAFLTKKGVTWWRRLQHISCKRGRHPHWHAMDVFFVALSTSSFLCFCVSSCLPVLMALYDLE
jgi:hypothetical protein